MDWSGLIGAVEVAEDWGLQVHGHIRSPITSGPRLTWALLTEADRYIERVQRRVCMHVDQVHRYDVYNKRFIQLPHCYQHMCIKK